MEEDFIKTMETLKATRQGRLGLSVEEARKTTSLNDKLIDEYLCLEKAAVSTHAAFRIAAVITDPETPNLKPEILVQLASALRQRIEPSNQPLTASDIEIAIFLWTHNHIQAGLVSDVVEGLRGSADFKLAEIAPRLLPIIGTEFIQPYLTSHVLSETGGMGGPRKPLIREMARKALADFQN